MNKDTEDKVFRNDPVKCVYMFVLGIITWSIFGATYYNEGGMDNFQNVILDIMLVFAIVMTLFIIYLLLPLEIIIYDKYVVYHKLCFKDKRVYWHNYNATNQATFTVSFIPIVWRYRINYIDSEKRKGRLYCGMLSGTDFSKLSGQFVDKKYEIELSKNTQIYYEENKNFVMAKKIEVPKKKIINKLFLPCRIALIITTILFLGQTIQGCVEAELKSKPMKVNWSIEEIVVLLIVILLFFSVPIYMYIHQKIVYPRVPSVILLQPEYIEIDSARFFFSEITKGVILYNNSVGKRILSFVCDGKKYRYYLGTVKENKEEIFPKYKDLVDYLQNKGFEVDIYTFRK